VFGEFGLTPKIVVTFADIGTPGIASVDVVSTDRYGSGTRAVDALNAIALPGQLKFYIPGGACPWNEDPRPFMDRAQRDQLVWAIVSFIWLDQWGGTQNCGIRSATTRPYYVDMGTRIKEAR
jgi:hypothetical protein